MAAALPADNSMRCIDRARQRCLGKGENVPAINKPTPPCPNRMSRCALAGLPIKRTSSSAPVTGSGRSSGPIVASFHPGAPAGMTPASPDQAPRAAVREWIAHRRVNSVTGACVVLRCLTHKGGASQLDNQSALIVDRCDAEHHFSARWTIVAGRRFCTPEHSFLAVVIVASGSTGLGNSTLPQKRVATVLWPMATCASNAVERGALARPAARAIRSSRCSGLRSPASD